MKRVLLKLSGEALAGEQKRGFDEATVTEVAKQIKTIVDEGLQVGIVIGGGNFWRGRTSGAMDRSKADQIQLLYFVLLRSAQMPFFLPRLLTESMTVIRR